MKTHHDYDVEMIGKAINVYSESDNQQQSNREKQLAELVDGCYNVVEIYRFTTPSQLQWQKDWLEKARKLVPGCDSLW